MLLDEIDLASNKILCLQSILEGKGVFLKKIGRWVSPASGFNVIATPTLRVKVVTTDDSLELTCSTSPFLERFPVTFEQEYPTVATEFKILNKICDDSAVDFYKRLADWADIIRKTFYDGGIEEVISTRRLVHIVKHIQSLMTKFQADASLSESF